jgi:hypothetical protein
VGGFALVSAAAGQDEPAAGTTGTDDGQRGPGDHGFPDRPDVDGDPDGDVGPPT